MIAVEKKDASGNEKEKRNVAKAKATRGKNRRRNIVEGETTHRRQTQMIQIVLLLLGRNVTVGSVAIKENMKGIGIGNDATKVMIVTERDRDIDTYYAIESFITL